MSLQVQPDSLRGARRGGTSAVACAFAGVHHTRRQSVVKRSDTPAQHCHPIPRGMPATVCVHGQCHQVCEAAGMLLHKLAQCPAVLPSTSDQYVPYGLLLHINGILLHIMLKLECVPVFSLVSFMQCGMMGLCMLAGQQSGSRDSAGGSQKGSGREDRHLQSGALIAKCLGFRVLSLFHSFIHSLALYLSSLKAICLQQPFHDRSSICPTQAAKGSTVPRDFGNRLLLQPSSTSVVSALPWPCDCLALCCTSIHLIEAGVLWCRKR